MVLKIISEFDRSNFKKEKLRNLLISIILNSFQEAGFLLSDDCFLKSLTTFLKHTLVFLINYQ